MAESGQIAIGCSALGHTPTYGVQIRENKGGNRWVLIMGLTGEIVEGTDERQLETILEAMSAKRHDAD
jgi:hypothetical protein